jgi:hypothetical protein
MVGMNEEPNMPLRGITFDRTINLGHVLTFFGMLCAGFLAWSGVQATLAVHDARLSEMERRQASDRADMVERMNLAVRDIRDALGRIEAKLDNKADKQPFIGGR